MRPHDSQVTALSSRCPAQPTVGRVVSLRLPCAGGCPGRRPPGFRVCQRLAVDGAQVLWGVGGQREALGSGAQLLQEAGSRRQCPGLAQQLAAQLRSFPCELQQHQTAAVHALGRLLRRSVF